nr:hypothetical protein [Tanacetum cinerariifolium]
MENANPSSPPESPNSFRNRKFCELNALELNCPAFKRVFSCSEGDVRFMELFKKDEIGYLSEGEIEEEEEVAEVEELVEDISSVIDLWLSQVVLGKPFPEVSLE